MQEAARPLGYFNPTSGEDLRQYPPSPQADFTRMALKIDIADMNVPRMDVVQSLTCVPLGSPMSTLRLDARLFKIKSVEVAKPAGRKSSFKHDGMRLEIMFDPPVPAGETIELLTTYTVENPPKGIIWTPETPEWPGRPAQLHSQGQAEDNSYWFPCHDSPNERLETSMVVTVPEGFQVCSNGRLVQRADKDESAGGRRTMFHWSQDKPHVNYLVSLVVGKFDVENVGRGKLSMPVYVPPGRAGDIKGTYGNTPRMVELFERRTGQVYPWDQYAQVVVWNFGAGGMENTSATTLFDTAIFSAEGRADGDMDGLISHELAHQWFGDLITCSSWEHIWLNEGFATYFTNLWWEERDGRDAYLAGIRANFDTIIAADKAAAPMQPGMVSKDFRNPGQAFRKAANPYPKGSSVLHMLRTKLGDEVFFKALAVYVDRYKFKLVETNDFRRTLEEVSGESLEQFFSQWCVRPGAPQLAVAQEWNAEAGELTLTVEQKQPIDGYNPAFALDLPVWVETKPGAGARPAGEIEVRTRKTVKKFKLDAEPTMIALDPNLAVLADLKLDQPMRRWMAQLERGPTLAAKVQAARGLGTDDSSIGASTLARIASDDKAPPALRRECIEALGARKDVGALGTLARSRIAHREVRETLMETAGRVLSAAPQGPDYSRLRDSVVSAAGREESQRVRAAALKAIGVMKLTDRLPMLIAGCEVESQHDRIRQASLEGLAVLGDGRGLPTAIRCAQFGNYSRTRPVAIDCIAALAHHDRAGAIAALAPLLDDRERRTWEAAGAAFASIADAKSKDVLERSRAKRTDPSDREKFAAWMAALKPAAASDTH